METKTKNMWGGSFYPLTFSPKHSVFFYYSQLISCVIQHVWWVGDSIAEPGNMVLWKSTHAHWILV